MRRLRGPKPPGSVVVMVTFALLLLLGVMGLVVDLGWAYFSRRAAQVAADAAAEAGARRAWELGTAAGGNYGSLDSAEITAKARAYAERNGFTDGGQGGRQAVAITSAQGPYPSGNLASLDILYYVETQVSTRLSALFIQSSGADGSLVSGATAVAAVLRKPVPGSIILLNPVSMDVMSGTSTGIDLKTDGGSVVQTEGGILINSSANGDGRSDGNYALQIGNNGVVKSSYLQIAQEGNFAGKADPASLDSILGLNGQPQAPFNGPPLPDPANSLNAGKQPPVPTVQQLVNSTPGNFVYGVSGPLGGSPGQPANLPPGVYVGVNFQGKPSLPTPNLAPIVITSDVNFLPGAHIFLGGLQIQNGNVTFGEGVYVAAGSQGQGQSAGMVFQASSNSKLLDSGSGNGELFLLTSPAFRPDSASPPLLDPNATFTIQPITNMGTAFGTAAVRSFKAVANLPFGQASLQAGQTNKADVNLAGLKGPPPGMDPQLGNYKPMLIWQDWNNRLNCSGCPKDSWLFQVQAGTIEGMHGTIYQPAGALLELQGSNVHTGNAQIITGAIHVSGSPSISLTAPTTPLRTVVVSLVR